MSVKEALDKVLAGLPEERLREVLDVAEFLNGQTEREVWRQFGQAQFARVYGPDEPNYTSTVTEIQSRRQANEAECEEK
jgi:hypothetical protein